jgi:hypothetical protein
MSASKNEFIEALARWKWGTLFGRSNRKELLPLVSAFLAEWGEWTKLAWCAEHHHQPSDHDLDCYSNHTPDLRSAFVLKGEEK